MRPNSHRISHFKPINRKGTPTYYWIPPKALRKAGIFRFVTLGRDFGLASAEAKEWNKKLDAYWEHVRGRRAHLERVEPMSAAFVARSFEASLKFSRSSERTR